MSVFHKTVRAAAVAGALALTSAMSPAMSPAQAATFAAPQFDGAQIIQVSGGCGPYGHRGPWGGCQPGGQWGPHIVGRPWYGPYGGAHCPPGTRLGPYRQACWAL